MRRWSAIVLFGFLTAGAAQFLDAQKPVVTKQITPDYRSLVSTVDELWAKSDAVLEVSTGPLITSRARGTAVYSLYDLRIVQVFKAPTDVKEGATIRLRRRGGTADLGDRIETQEVEGYPAFTLGDRYIMFLRRSNDTPDFGVYFYETTFGPDSVFAIVSERGDTPTHGKSPLARRLSKGGPDGLRAAILRLRGGK